MTANLWGTPVEVKDGPMIGRRRDLFEITSVAMDIVMDCPVCGKTGSCCYEFDCGHGTSTECICTECPVCITQQRTPDANEQARAEYGTPAMRKRDMLADTDDSETTDWVDR